MSPAVHHATKRSITIPDELYAKIGQIAEQRHVSGNRAIVDLLEDAIGAYERRRATFLDVADKFQNATDPVEIERLRQELVQMTFGD